jgi:hypothetical protein
MPKFAKAIAIHQKKKSKGLDKMEKSHYIVTDIPNRGIGY